MRKKLMMVARISSGTCAARCFIMLGQNRPTQASNRQKATSCSCPCHVMPAHGQRAQNLLLLRSGDQTTSDNASVATSLSACYRAMQCSCPHSLEQQGHQGMDSGI